MSRFVPSTEDSNFYSVCNGDANCTHNFKKGFGAHVINSNGQHVNPFMTCEPDELRAMIYGLLREASVKEEKHFFFPFVQFNR